MSNEIANAEALTEVYGAWPAFHDAEVIHFALARPLQFRAAPLTLDLTIADVHGPPETASVVTLRFSGVRDVKLDGFDDQNVLFELELTPPDGERHLWKIVCFGSSAFAGEWMSDRVEVVAITPLRRHS